MESSACARPFCSDAVRGTAVTTATDFPSGEISAAATTRIFATSAR